MKITFRAFKATHDPETCEKYIRGHVSVLQDYGITNITSNNNLWMFMDCVYGVVAEDENGELVGGIRIQIADGINPLPVEKAVGYMDPSLYDMVKKFIPEGVGELCGLWNAKSIAGMGISVLLTRAGISITSQLTCKTLMGICAGYTLKMFNRVGFVIDNSLGKGGEFVYPNENYIAWVLGILNAKDLQTADPLDRDRMLSLRNNPVQFYSELSKDGTADIYYNLVIPPKTIE
ncbi:MAG: hypothetical protein V4687_17420 [Bacteroidota bacterium]